MTNQQTTSVTKRRDRTRRHGVKGRALLLFRLARQDVRHHLAQAVLLVVAIAAVTATLTLAFALNGVNSAENGVNGNPYQQTMAATKGPDVLAQSSPETNGTTPADLAALVPLNQAQGVAAHSGPYPMAMAEMRSTGIDTEASVEGRQPGVAAVDQPLVTDGTWIRPGGVVVERSFAEATNLRLGQTITLNSRSFRVVGLAVTAAFAGASGINLMWATEAAARSLATTDSPLTYYSNLKLSDASPGAISAFVNAHMTNSASSPYLVSWTVAASQDTGFLRSDQAVLLTGATLLGLLALASVAVLVGGRLAESTRRVGLLKAVGGTPGLVAATFLTENLFLALVAACVGLLAGWGAAPLLSSPGSALVGSSGTPPLTLVAVGVAVGAALIVALASTFVPAIRAARTSTVSALADAPRLPKRRDSLIELSQKLPVPALLGLRLVARRPRRAILSAASIAVAVMGLVAALAIRAGRGKEVRSLRGRACQPEHQPSGAGADRHHDFAGHPGGPYSDLHRPGDGPRRETRVRSDVGAGRNATASPSRVGHDAGHPRATWRDPRPPTRPRSVQGCGSRLEWLPASALAGRRSVRNCGRCGGAHQCYGADRPPPTRR